MKKVLSLMKHAAIESIVYLRDLNIRNDFKNKLTEELNLIEQGFHIKSNGITSQWIYLIKSEQANGHAFALGQISAMICASLPSSEIEKVKNIMIASSVISTYLSMESQSQF